MERSNQLPLFSFTTYIHDPIDQGEVWIDQGEVWHISCGCIGRRINIGWELLRKCYRHYDRLLTPVVYYSRAEALRNDWEPGCIATHDGAVCLLTQGHVQPHVGIENGKYVRWI